MTGKHQLSLGRLALLSLSAAVSVLALTVVILTVARPGPAMGLLIVGIGMVCAIAAMGYVATRIVNRATRDDQGEVVSDDYGDDAR